MKLIIDRRKWLRGDHDSALLRSSDNKMCCLGFFCKAKGVTRIKDVVEPCELSYNARERIEELFNDRVEQNNVCEKLIVTNDNILLSEKTRETRITKWFKKIGVDVVFEN